MQKRALRVFIKYDILTGMELLDKLTSPTDIREMSIKELYGLCDDIRAFMLANVSKTGGHLASNLGAVELTVAIHNVFDTAADRLVFDVGHQCYVHKILTGRKDAFNKLRSKDGISGFPNPAESVHDAFISGHASTSVSVALGMARARTLLGDDYSVIAVIGDGAMTGGLAFEALSDAGQSGEPLIIILNDNEMSITENVGGLSKHLAHLRMRPYYLSVKKVWRKTIAKVPLLGIGLTRFLRAIKKSIKDAVKLPSSVFESMGFMYIGPTDGHNIKEVCRLLKVAESMAKPVLIHLKTIKGKGYIYAEESPEDYHGVPGFDIENGELLDAGGDTFASVFGQAITTLANDDKKICAITAAMQSGTGLDEFARSHPERFFDVGIAEGHAVTTAGGLAKQGMIPVCAIYSTFIQRAYDMLFHDVCLMNLHVVFAIDRAGFVADDGPTHQGTYDVGIFLQMPEMTVLCPSSIGEIKDMLRFALYEVKGPVAIRYPRGGSDCVVIAEPPYEPMLLREGKQAAVITYGRLVSNALQAALLLCDRGIDTAVIKLTNISDVTARQLVSMTGDYKYLFIAEECVSAGSLASKLALEIAGYADKTTPAIIPINIGTGIPPPATTDELMCMYGLDSAGIADYISSILKL